MNLQPTGIVTIYDHEKLDSAGICERLNEAGFPIRLPVTIEGKWDRDTERAAIRAALAECGAQCLYRQSTPCLGGTVYFWQ